MPSCQTTAVSEATTTSAVERPQRVNQKTNAVAISTAIAKKARTARTPSIRSPTIFAKPVMWMRTPCCSYFARSSSSRVANCA